MKLNLAVLAGDGIGPEIMEQALKAVKAVCSKFGHELKCQTALIGACAIDGAGNPYPDETHELCMNSDAVLFGAIGSPEYDSNPSAKVRPEQGLLAMRKRLGLFANIRPVTGFPSLLNKSPLRREIVENVDLMCIRELTGGLYFGRPQGRSEDGLTAYDTCVYTRGEIDRSVRLACDHAMKRRTVLSIGEKANILATSRLWREVAQGISKEFPMLETEYMFVDNAAMRLIQNPRSFDVMVTENMFGDILTDEASVITGSLGMLPSASTGLHTSVFEPVHGSWPQAAGKNIANPLAMILSAAMMFEYAFDLQEEGRAIRNAVNASLEAGIVTDDIARTGKSYGTSEAGTWIQSFILNADFTAIDQY
jgi:3-isopropylmalate dehydrogenase